MREDVEVYELDQLENEYPLLLETVLSEAASHNLDIDDLEFVHCIFGLQTASVVFAEPEFHTECFMVELFGSEENGYTVEESTHEEVD